MSLQRVAVVGVGMIGATLALAIRRARPGISIVGYDPQRPEAGVDAGIERWSTTAEEACGQADLVILAAPIGAIVGLLPTLARTCPPESLVTDTGSSKAEICRVAREAFAAASGPHFVGGHPMAGSERAGAAAADPDLLRGAPYALCAGETVPAAKRQEIAALVSATGARPVWVEPEEHDRIVARVSHLPQVLVTALASLLEDEAAKHPALASLAGSGLRDLLRLASSPYGLWKDILRSNGREIRPSIALLAGRLSEMSARLDEEELAGWFEKGRRFREQRLRGEV